MSKSFSWYRDQDQDGRQDFHWIKKRCNSNSLCWKHDAVQAETGHLLKTDNLGNQSSLLEQPTDACGILRRRSYWENISQASLSPLAREIEALQSNCSLPIATFQMDNDFGLGSHLYLWSQAFCNAWEAGYRVRIHNPNWLWLDQSYCDQNLAKKSPLLLSRNKIVHVVAS